MNPAELINIAEQERSHWWYRGMRSILGSVLGSQVGAISGHRVLEAGCGTGYNSVWLRNLYNWDVYPIDVEEIALLYGRQLGLQNPTQGDVRSLPFRSDSFHLGLCLDVLVHVGRGDERRVMTELFRVIAPGGLLILRAAAFDALRSRHSLFIDEKQRFRRRQLTQLASESGFDVLRCTYANFLLLPVAFAKFRIWEPLVRGAAHTGIEATAAWLNALLYAPLVLESKWLRLGFNLPLGQSLLLLARKA